MKMFTQHIKVLSGPGGTCEGLLGKLHLSGNICLGEGQNWKDSWVLRFTEDSIAN